MDYFFECEYRKYEWLIGSYPTYQIEMKICENMLNERHSDVKTRSLTKCWHVDQPMDLHAVSHAFILTRFARNAENRSNVKPETR